MVVWSSLKKGVTHAVFKHGAYGKLWDMYGITMEKLMDVCQIWVIIYIYYDVYIYIMIYTYYMIYKNYIILYICVLLYIYIYICVIIYIVCIYIYIHLLLYYLVVRRGWFGAYRVFIFPLSEDFQAISRLSGARVTIPSPTNYYILSMKDRYIYIYISIYGI